jgi:hypothetical protein
MSWDIFVQDLPKDASTIEEIADDFAPGPIGKRSQIIDKIREIVPAANFSEPSLEASPATVLWKFACRAGHY